MRDHPAIPDLIETGQICAICHKTFFDEYCRPLACESCGGDGVLSDVDNIRDAIDAWNDENGQFGMGA